MEKSLTPLGVVEPVDSLPYIAGHQVNPGQWKAFDVWHRTGDVSLAAAAANVTLATFRDWRKTQWWTQLYDEWFRPAQEDFVRGIVERDADALKAYQDILTGERCDDRSASAAAALLKLRTEIGKDPIVNRRPVTNINTGLQINAGQVNVQVLQQMTQDELLDFNVSGRIPNRLRPESPTRDP